MIELAIKYTLRMFLHSSFWLILLIMYLVPPAAFATTNAYKITDGFTVSSLPKWNYGYVYFTYSLPITFDGGKIIISSNPEGSGSAQIGDVFQVINTPPGGIAKVFTYRGSSTTCLGDDTPLPATDITNLFIPGMNNTLIRLSSWCAKTKVISPLYLVIKKDDPSPATPTPFLDLPWDYEAKGLTFSEAATSINTYFDHEYPLLSFAWAMGEPDATKGSVIYYLGGERNFDRDYSSHDGYDYGRMAKANLGDPVLAAASGSATYVNTCTPCGNAIYIDHGNGYQTRYYHLLKDGLITDIPNNPVSVTARQQIGKVGFTGNVIPKNENGAHIHFMVVQDKNHDGDFKDNIPDGLTDPFGWQSTDPDPWENFTYTYNNITHTGNKSYYLWKKKIDGLRNDLPTNGGIFTVGKYTVTFPEDPTRENLRITMQTTPIAHVGETISSLGSTMSITAQDAYGNLVTLFTKPLLITIDFSTIDLTRYKLGTISIYSSTDHVHWKKEDSFTDYLHKKTTAEVNHLTYFALMAERADTIAPTTTPIFQGDAGETGWYRSAVTLTLDAQDNADGLGVDYIVYRIGEGDWEEYIQPLTFTDEGTHSIEFYAVDKDDNIEETKSVTFTIDKTPPTVSITANPQFLWPPDGRMVPVTISGRSDDSNLNETNFSINDEYALLEPHLTHFDQTVLLEAKRDGYDVDGRTYTVQAVAHDKAGNQTVAETHVYVAHDKALAF